MVPSERHPHMPVDTQRFLDLATDDPDTVVRGWHLLRTLGLGFGGFMAGVVLYGYDTAAPVWLSLILHAGVWPHASTWIMRRRMQRVADELRLQLVEAIEQRFILVDAAACGAWIALMRLNALPSAVTVTMLTIAVVTIHGWRTARHVVLVMAIACGCALLANGMAFAPGTRLPEMLAALPVLVTFPLTLAGITHQLAERVRAQNAQLKRLGSRDSLSGLLNRGCWEDAVTAALAQEKCAEAAMLLIDIDHFKRVNDHHGHLVGDAVIRQVGQIIRDNLREDDLAGRYGGDEFCVVVRGARTGAAALVAERIRQEVALAFAARAPTLRCTLSIGLARVPTSSRTIRAWVRDADAALYRAKLAGRNRCAAAG